VMEMEKISYPEAIKNLARKFSVELSYEGDSEGDNRNREEENSRREELYELYRRTAVTFHHFLMKTPEGKPALDYLLSRSIGIETIERFRLGFSPENRNWLYGFLQKKGYSAEFLDGSGLFSANYRGMAFFSGRLMFPIADRHGRVVSFGGRAMPGAVQSDGKEPPKYINTGESETYKKGQTLYALDLALPEIRRSKTVYLAEGYMDVIALHQAGVHNAVATCGTAFTDEQAKLLRNWAETAVLVFDSDEAGQTAVFKGIINCRKNGLACSVAVPAALPAALPADLPDKALPGGAGNSDGAPGSEDPPVVKDNRAMKDPADILQKFGGDVLKKSMKCDIIDIDYLVSRGKILFDITTPGGKKRAVSLFYPYFNALDSKTERDTCIEVVADAMRADKGAVLGDYERWRRSGGGTYKPAEERNFEEVPDSERTIRMNDELFLLMVVSVNANLYPEFRASVSMREIEDQDAKELFIALEECFINGESGTEAFLSRLGSERLKNFFIERGMSPEFRGDSGRDPGKMMKDGIRRVKAKRFRRRKTELGAELRLREKNSGVGEDELKELIDEMMYIDAELRKLEGE